MALVTAAEPLVPEIVLGPVALNVHAVAAALPPLELSTDLVSVRLAGPSVFAKSHRTFWPSPSAKLATPVEVLVVPTDAWVSESIPGMEERVQPLRLDSAIAYAG